MTEKMFRDIAQREAGEYDREAFFDLADELTEPKYAVVRRNLVTGEYDDFANERLGAPKVQMHNDFLELGRADIAAQVVEGKFDQ
jgi:adenosine deaminase